MRVFTRVLKTSTDLACTRSGGRLKDYELETHWKHYAVSLSKTLYPLQAALIVLVQPRKTGECPIITKKTLTGRSTKDPLFILRNSQQSPTISVTVTLNFNPMQVLGMVNPHQHFILSEFVFLGKNTLCIFSAYLSVFI